MTAKRHLDTFIVFCTQTTRLFDNMNSALTAAFNESAQRGGLSVDVYASNSADEQPAIILATVQARN